MKASSLREQTDEELENLLHDTEKEILGLHVKSAGSGSPEQPLRIRTLRRDLARIKTVLRERGGKQ
jgi:large subunit ribosomal protein L29